VLLCFEGNKATPFLQKCVFCALKVFAWDGSAHCACVTALLTNVCRSARWCFHDNENETLLVLAAGLPRTCPRPRCAWLVCSSLSRHPFDLEGHEAIVWHLLEAKENDVLVRQT
jgi:hypothetical protein